MPEVERYGVEPIPAAARTVGWHDLFAINFTFFLNPVMMVLGALAVLESGLPLPWALVATIVGQALAYLALTIVAQAGVDDGLPGQVAMRASFGGLGARALTSPYRVIASVYWFAAQALTAAFGVQALAVALADVRPSLVPTALLIAVVQAGVAALGFDVMRWLLRIVLPLSVATAGLLLALWLVSDEPDYAVARVVESPEQQLTWVGFATVVTVMCGSSLTLVTNIADLTRYTRSRRDMRIGLVGSTLAATATTTLIGGVYAVGSGETNPFVAASALTSNEVVLSVLLLAIVVLTFAANVTNVYTGGLSLVSSLPALGRVLATGVVGLAAIALSGFPSLIEEAQSWITHLGNVAAPLTGVVLADYLVRQRGRIDVEALFEPAGRYRYLRGINVEAVAAVACGIAVYYAVPDAWVKVVWGAGSGAAGYLALTSRRAGRPSRGRRAALGVTSAAVAVLAILAVLLLTTTSSRAEPTRAQYLAQVAAVCRVYGPRLDRIRPPDVAEPANVIEAVDRVLPLVKAQLGRVKALEPPRELRRRIERWLVLHERRLRMLERAQAAGRRQDFRALGVAYVDFALAGSETGRLAREIGIPHPPC